MPVNGVPKKRHDISKNLRIEEVDVKLVPSSVIKKEWPFKLEQMSDQLRESFWISSFLMKQILLFARVRRDSLEVMVWS